MHTRRTRPVTVATIVALVALLMPSAARPAGAFTDEPLFRPPGLDPDWPGCTRADGNGIDSVGCAVNDVPGGQANADQYVFLHGKAFLNGGTTIENLNALSPWGQGESVGRIYTVEESGLFALADMRSGTSGAGWWGVWVPVERLGANGDMEPMPNVQAFIGPRVSYTSLYNHTNHTPPASAPPGAFSDEITPGAGNRAILVPDLVMPGPPRVQIGCQQVDYTAAGGRVRCDAVNLEAAAIVAEWTWPDGTVESGLSVERVFPDDGTYRVWASATRDDGWILGPDDHAFLVSECRAEPCLEAVLVDTGADPPADVPFEALYDITNLGEVPLTEATIGFPNGMPDGLSLLAPVPTIATLAPGETQRVTVSLLGDAGPKLLERWSTALLPSGREATGAFTVDEFAVGGTDLEVTLTVPDPVPLGVAGGTVEVRNRSSEPIEAVEVYLDTDDPTLLALIGEASHAIGTVGPGEAASAPFDVQGQAAGTTRLRAEAYGTRPDGTGIVGRTAVEVHVGAGDLVVNTTGDEADPDVTDGRCDVDPDTAGDQCPLRAAIMEANERPGHDTVTFALPMPGPIAVGAPLPAVVGPATIDGSGQPGLVVDGGGGPGVFVLEGTAVMLAGVTVRNAATPVLVTGAGQHIVRDVAVEGGDPGIWVQSPANTLERVRASFAVTGIFVDSTGNMLVDVVAGLDESGSGAQANGRGLVLAGDGNTVTGGTFTANAQAQVDVRGDANTLAGVHVGFVANGVDGLRVPGASGVVIAGGSANAVVDSHVTLQAIGILIGGGRANRVEGTFVTKSETAGIAITKSEANQVVANTVGDNAGLAAILVTTSADLGDVPDPRPTQDNLVEGNNVVLAPTGVMVDGAARTSILRNWIAGNTGPGVTIVDVSATPDGTVVKGNGIGILADRVEPNQGPGIVVAAGTGATIGGPAFGDANGIFANTGPGITVGAGATRTAIVGNEIASNGSVGIETGAPDAPAPPVVLGASPGAVTVRAHGTPGQTVSVELFVLGECDPSGAGEGDRFVARQQVTTGALGTADATLAPGQALPAGAVVSATATPATGSTSAFATCAGVGDATLSAAFADLPAVVAAGAAVTASVEVTNAGPTDVDDVTITFEVDDPAVAALVAHEPVHVAQVRAGTTTRVPVPIDAASIGSTVVRAAVEAHRGVEQVTTRAASTIVVGTATRTMSTSAAQVGTQVIETATNVGFAIGDAVRIDPGTPIEESRRIVGFGSIVVDRPLQHAHEAGAVVEQATDVDLPPSCSGVELATDEDTAANGQVACLDEDPATVTFAPAGPVPEGLAVGADGALPYAPPANFHGTVLATVVATDGAGQASAPITVTITVRPVNDLPSCSGIEASGDVGVEVLLAPSCADADGDAVEVAIETAPASGVAVVRDGQLAYTPAEPGTHTFTYVAHDGAGASAPSTVTVTVAEPPPPGGLVLTITRAWFVAGARAPSAFLLTGRLEAVGTSSLACGDDVTLRLGGGLWSETLPGAGFRSVGGRCAWLGVTGSRWLVGFSYSVHTGLFTATGLGRRGALAGLTNPVAIDVTVGDDTGSASVHARIR